MTTKSLQIKKKIPVIPILGVSAIVLLSAFMLLKMLPEHRTLILYALYAVQAHMLIAIFPNEPALLFCAKYYPPLTITLASTISYLIAGVLDYWLLIPLLHHQTIRSRFEDKHLFEKSMRYFKKSPFLLMVVANFLPIPFYPFKFLCIAGGYPLWKYELSMLIGRLPRYYLLAYLGYALQIPTWILIILFLTIVSPPLVNKLISKLKGKPSEITASLPEEGDAESLIAEYQNYMTNRETPS